MRRPIIIGAVAMAMAAANPASAAKPPTTWDGLVQVKSKRLHLVYLQPGADFRAYTKVMVDPTEVSFAKDWQREYNRSTMSLSSRVTDKEMEDAISRAVKAADDIFASAWTKGGYAIVTAPGPDVMRVKTGVVNVSVTAPDLPTAGRSYSVSADAGSATLFVEARDSMLLSRSLIGCQLDLLRIRVRHEREVSIGEGRIDHPR